MAGSVPAASTVLVVEDDTLLRMDAVEIISSAGYHVLEASSSSDAIAILEKRLDITLVFTDIEMPGAMNGIKLAQAIRGRWPPIKIIATSGYYRLQENDLPSDGVFLAKPYSSRQILRAISHLIAA